MPDVTELLHSARAAVDAGNHKAALPLLDEAATLGPDLFGVHMLRGICLTEMGRPAEGARALQRAVHLNSTSAQAHYHLALALRSTRFPKEAEQHFRLALRLQPGYEAAAKGLRSLDDGATTGAATRTPKPAGTRPPGNLQQPLAQRPRPRRRVEKARQPRPPAAQSPRRALKLNWKWAALGLLAAVAAGLIGGRTRAGTASSFIVWQTPGSFAALDFSPDGELLAAAGEKVMLWRTATGVPYRQFTWGEKAVALAFSPRGTALAVSARDERTGDSVKLWRMPDSGLVGVLPQTAGNRPLAFSPDGNVLAVGTDYMSTATPLGVQLWTVPACKIVGAVARPEPVSAGYVTAITFSPDGKLIASADDSGTAWLSTVADRSRLETIRTGNMMAVALAFSPSGKTLAYGGSSGPTVTICTVPDGRPLRTLQGDTRARGKLGMPPAVKALAFSPDGSLLATCESTGDLARIELFRVADGMLLKTLDPSRLSGERESRDDSPLDLRAIHFSPDGKYLAWCGTQGVVVARVSGLIG